MRMTQGLLPLDALVLRNAVVSSLYIEAPRKISIRVFTFGQHDQDPNAGKEYELLLANVAGFRLTSLHLPSRIQGHSLAMESSFIDELKKMAARSALWNDPPRLHHYQLITDTGQIDVASEITGALPFVAVR